MNNSKIFFKFISQCLKFLFKAIKIILGILPKLSEQLTSNIQRRLRFSISFKMTAVYTLIFSTILFLLSTSLIIGFRFFLLKQVNDELTKYSLLATNYAKSEKILENLNVDNFSNIKYITLSIFDEKEALITSTQKDKKNLSFYKEDSNTPLINEINQNLIFVTSKVTISDKILFLQLSKSIEKENEYWVAFIFIIFFINILSLIFTLSIGSKFSKKMLLPIKHMTKTTKAISINALETRLNVSNSYDELKDLAITFNDMLDRIQSSYEIQNQFVSDASHELRTPISVIQGYANMLHRWGKDDKEVLDESIAAIKCESENMQQLVEKLLFLARSDNHTQKIEKEMFHINELVNEIIKETRLIDLEHSILSNINENIAIYADKKLLKQALRVFIDNSIKYTPAGGNIELNAYVKKKDLVLEIIDNGMGIPKEDLPYIFNRFYRCDKSRAKESGGTGLGLSIAKWIIGKHNGSIVVESNPNVGTKIIIGIPIKGIDSFY